jgi:hypothetical protein
MLIGMKNIYPSPPDARLPITLVIQQNMLAVVREQSFSPFIDIVPNAVFLLTFYGFLCGSEFTTLSNTFFPFTCSWFF